MSGPRSASSLPVSSIGWWELLRRFPRAPGELLALRDLPRRTDCKFIATPSAAAELVRSLPAGYAVLPANREMFASYLTRYFDTEELDFFHAHRRGFRVRHKVRIRHYADRRVTFLEIKTRSSELRTTKTRREREYGNETLTADDQAFIDLQTGIGRNVARQVWTDFRRLTLLGIETNERITIDLDLAVGAGSEAASLGAVAIVEVKQWPFDRSTPVMSALRARGLRPGWLSKYCVAVARTRPGVRLHRLLPGLRALERAAA